MSALVTMLGEIMYDMIPFLTLMCFVILVNSFSFELLSPLESEAYGTFKQATSPFFPRPPTPTPPLAGQWCS